MGFIQCLRATSNTAPRELALPAGPVTPINIDRLAFLLQGHHSIPKVSYVLRGLRSGFDIGFRGLFSNDNTRPNNLLSARNNTALVKVALDKEIAHGHTFGPFASPPFPKTHCSPLGAAPKPDGSVRLFLIVILHWSATNLQLPHFLFTS